MRAVTVVLQGDAEHAEADAAVLNDRLRRHGYAGEARARRGGIEVDFRLPGDLKPDRMLRKILAPGRLAIRQEQSSGDGVELVADCTAGPDACVEVAVGQARLTSAHVAEANTVVDPANNALAVVLHFTDEGRRLLEQLTAEVVGQRLVIEVDGQVVSRPRIDQPITNGTAVVRFGSQGLFARSATELEGLASQMVGRALGSAWNPKTED